MGDASPTQWLRDASAQDIQLELLRRATFNGLDGEMVVARLHAHRDLWLAALLDRIVTRDAVTPWRLPASWLIKLRDLPDNWWNADTLYILTRSIGHAERLARIISEEDWACEIAVFQNQDEIDAALGTGEHYGILRLWWD